MPLPTDRRVVITGIGSVTPVGFGVDAFWDGVLNKRSNLTRIPPSRFDDQPFKTTIGGFVPDFDIWLYLEKTPRNRAFIQRFERYTKDGKPVTARALLFSMAATSLAMRDANKQGKPLEGPELGAVIGTAFADESLVFSDAGSSDGRKVILATAYAQTGVATFFIGARGPSYGVSSACTTCLTAMDVASELHIRKGRVKAMLTGASSSYLGGPIFKSYDSISVLSTRNDDPAAAMRPFDEDRDGFVLSEGSVIHIIEGLEDAKKRGAIPYAEVIATVQHTAQIESMMNVCEEGYYQITKAVLDEAIASGRLGANEIYPDSLYVHAHGTATKENEVFFTAAVTRALSEHGIDPKRVATSCVYSVTGHLQDNAGGVAISAAALALHHGVVPPTHNLERPITDSLYLVRGEPLRKQMEYALVIGAGFCGTYGAVLLKRYPREAA